jgi:NADP-dependent 3-hydroxy acid dehydrogenase YdfG
VASDALQGVALVTGGGRGIGASIARELTDAGMRVAVSGRSSEQVRAVADELSGLALIGDVTRHDDVEAWVERTERELGPIDLLVANAGVSGSGRPFLDESIEDWWRVFEVNVLGPYLSCRAVGARMAERGRGRIVNVGSGGSYLPITNPTISLGTSYGPSKAALGRFTEILAAVLLEWPRRDDTRLADVRDAVDASRHPPEDHLSPPLGSDRVCTRAVDRGPDDLGRGLARRPGGCVQRLTAGNGTDVDLEPAAFLANPTNEALTEIRAAGANMPCASDLAVLDGHGLRRIDGQRGRSRFGDDGFSVEQAHAVLVEPDHEWPHERRRKTQRHLDLVGVDIRGQPTAGVSTVRRAQGPTVASVKRYLHEEGL